jgi:hypothetical protein
MNGIHKNNQADMDARHQKQNSQINGKQERKEKRLLYPPF